MSAPVLVSCRCCGASYDVAAWLALPLDGMWFPKVHVCDVLLEQRTCPAPCHSTHTVPEHVVRLASEGLSVAIQIRDLDDGEIVDTCDVASFVEANVDAEELVLWARRALPGDRLETGGGAQPSVELLAIGLVAA